MTARRAPASAQTTSTPDRNQDLKSRSRPSEAWHSKSQAVAERDRDHPPALSCSADGAVEDAAVRRQNTAGLELAGREAVPFAIWPGFIILTLNRKGLEWDTTAGSVGASGQTSSFPARATESMSRLEQLAKSEEPRLARLSAIVLEVAQVTPYKRRRLKILARNHRDLLRKLGKTGLLLHTWHRAPDSVFDETHLEEAEFFAEEGKTELPAPEDSKTTDLPDAEDREIPF